MTTEFAAVMPAVLLILVTALGAMQLAGEQLRLQAATVDAARMLGRGDAGAAARVSDAVGGAMLTQSRREDLVCVDARAPTALGILSAITLSARACVLDDAS